MSIRTDFLGETIPTVLDQNRWKVSRNHENRWKLMYPPEISQYPRDDSDRYRWKVSQSSENRWNFIYPPDTVDELSESSPPKNRPEWTRLPLPHPELSVMKSCQNDPSSDGSYEENLISKKYGGRLSVARSYDNRNGSKRLSVGGQWSRTAQGSILQNFESVTRLIWVLRTL